MKNMGYTITLAVGIILLIISVVVFRNSLNFLKNSNRATGTVIELERVSGSDGDTFKPVFKFKTYTNQEVIFKRNSSSNPPGWRIGEEANIAYDANNPSNARLLTYFGSFGLAVILLAIAMPMLVLGGGYYLSQQFLR